MGLREDGDGGRAKEVWAQKVLAGTASARLSPGLAIGFDGSGTAANKHNPVCLAPQNIAGEQLFAA